MNAPLVVDPERPHLGGYKAGGDPATLYPELWTWLVLDQGVRSVVDVGCGDGQALRYFYELGCDVLGVEGLPQDNDAIVEHDYATGPYVPDRRFDLAWSCEFVEHVEVEHAFNYLATFDAADLLLMTHAEPGQEGHHHVNCRRPSFWHLLLGDFGFRYDEPLTLTARALAGANPSPWNHFRRSGLAFRRLAPS